MIPTPAFALKRVPRSKKKVYPDNARHANALTEMGVIGACMHIVSTRLSTFSYAAHARALKTPWVVGRGDPVCRRARTSQHGLFVGQPVHDKWPWQTSQLSRVSCSEGLPDDEEQMKELLSGRVGM